jgi:hypothetical protein
MSNPASIRHLSCVVPLDGRDVEQQGGPRAREGAGTVRAAVEAAALGSLLGLTCYFFTSLAFLA